jgi:ZIP family zinc transporter
MSAVAWNWNAFLLATISGMSTAIGGLLVIFFGAPSATKLGIMLSASCGVMLYISFMDLLPEAQEEIGYVMANIWFFVGMFLFGLAAHFFPDGHDHEGEGHSHANGTNKAKKGNNNNTPAKNGKNNNNKTNGAAKPKKVVDAQTEEQRQVGRVGFVTALGISLHNIPEGIAVYVTCLKGIEFGAALMVAIAAHNIPEGAAVASPIYHSTKSKWQAFKYCLVSGVCEPLGALIFGIFFSQYMNDYVVKSLLAGVAGIMVLVSLRELLPTALKYMSAERVMLWTAAGMLFMSISILALHGSGGHNHSHDGHGHGHGHAHVNLEHVKNVPHDHAHAHIHDDHHHEHDHAHGHDHTHDHDHDHDHDHGHMHDHSHGHDHGHDHSHDHAHAHDHSHDHDHAHHHHGHAHAHKH